MCPEVGNSNLIVALEGRRKKNCFLLSLYQVKKTFCNVLTILVKNISDV